MADRCVDCGIELDPGASKVFTCCDECWDKKHPPKRSPARDCETRTLNGLRDECHAAAAKWWHTPDGKRLERNKGELLMLIVSEVAEAMEGERKNLMDDKLPHRRMAEVELVDALIRIFDYAGAFGYDLDGAYREKMGFNAVREDHTYEARARADGKQW